MNLITMYRKNFHDTKQLQKRYYNKNIKAKSYAYNNKVWLNNK